MDISKLDKKTQNYIKDLEHCIEVQNELIDAQKEIIDNLESQINIQQDYVQKLSDSIKNI